ncbi:MAG: hypothetical protein QM594_08090 [Niabella sp.]
MKNLIIVITSIAMLWGCISKNELYKGNLEGKEYRFQQVTKNQGFNKAYSQTLKIEGISNGLDINAESTSPGYPYSFNIYKDIPYIILDSVSYQYKNEYNDAAKHFATLYINPDKFSKDDFEQFADFFQNEWNNIKNKVPLNQGYRTLQIVALVYGTDKQFERQYMNKETPATKTITIKTDGQILYSEATGSVQSTNLSEKIQMPGKIIYVEKDGQYSIDNLRAFKSNKDRPLELDFELNVR